MLKLDDLRGLTVFLAQPAAFGRLCVETMESEQYTSLSAPAAFGRLCVETMESEQYTSLSTPAAFGRLCVETDV